MPGARWFPGARLNYAEHVFRAATRRRVGDRARRPSCASCGELTWGELRDAGRARSRAGLRALGVGPATASPPTCRTSPRRSSPSSPPPARRRLVGVLARLRRPQRGRPLRPDRAEGAARRRRLPLRRQGLRPPRRGRARSRPRCRRCAHGRRSALPRRRHAGWDDASPGEPRASAAAVRARALRPPALGALLLGHHRPAQGDRARPRRDPARAPQEARTCTSTRPGDRFFWFTTTGWMMWNFLVGGLLTGPSIVLYDGSPGHPDMGVLWGLAEAARHHHFGTGARLHRRLHEGGRASRGDGRDLSRAARRRLDRLAALARGLRLGLRAVGDGHVAVLDQRRHRRLHGLRRRLPDRCPCYRGEIQVPRARRRRRGVRRGRPARSSTRSASW